MIYNANTILKRHKSKIKTQMENNNSYRRKKILHKILKIPKDFLKSFGKYMSYQRNVFPTGIQSR